MATRAHLREQITSDKIGALTPVAFATVSVYETGTTTPVAATMYQTASGVGVFTNPLTADANGVVEFWMTNAQVVDLAITAAGYNAATVTAQVIGTDTATGIVNLNTTTAPAVAGDVRINGENFTYEGAASLHTAGTLDQAQTYTGLKTFSSGVSADGTHTLTLPAATDTLVGKATTDTLTNKTLTSPTLATPQDSAAHRVYTLRSRTIVQQGTTSYAIPSGVTALLVQCLGAGGGGGGCATAASASGCGAGGASGGYSESFITSPPASPVTVAVGQGGAAGTAGANAGGNGGNTTFNTTTVVANGGGGGGGPSASGSAVVLANGPAAPAAGTGDVALPGVPGGSGFGLGASGGGVGGNGGNAPGPYGGGGGRCGAGGGGAGNNGGTYGSGGGAGVVLNGSASVAGGAGANGLMVIWEFE